MWKSVLVVLIVLIVPRLFYVPYGMRVETWGTVSYYTGVLPNHYNGVALLWFYNKCIVVIDKSLLDSPSLLYPTVSHEYAHCYDFMHKGKPSKIVSRSDACRLYDCSSKEAFAELWGLEYIHACGWDTNPIGFPSPVSYDDCTTPGFELHSFEYNFDWRYQ